MNLSRSLRARAGPIWALMGPYGPEEFQKISKRLALLGACKGPCTLPYAAVCKGWTRCKMLDPLQRFLRGTLLSALSQSLEL